MAVWMKGLIMRKCHIEAMEQRVLLSVSPVMLAARTHPRPQSATHHTVKHASSGQLIDPVGYSQQQTVNMPLTSLLGSFVDTDSSNINPSKYSQSRINWGDGTPLTVASFTRTGSDNTGSDWNVSGTHTYTTTGVKHVVITVKSSSGSSTTIMLDVTVVSPSTTGSQLINPVGYNQSQTVNMPYTSVLGSFVDQDPNNIDPGRYSQSTINWGDGTPLTSASFTRTGSDPNVGSDWNVSGTHTYNSTGVKHVVINVKSSTGASTTITLDITVVSGTTGPQLINPTGYSQDQTVNMPYTSLLGSFIDQDPNNIDPNAYSQSTINWGDGTPLTSASFTRTGSDPNIGSYWNVSGTHTYTTTGVKNVVINVKSVNDGSTTITLQINVVPATTGGSSLTSPMGYSQNQTVNTADQTLLGSFVDQNANNIDPSVYSQSTINWGDGVTTAASFTRTGSSPNVGSDWNVLGMHAYATTGVKHVVIHVIGAGGASTTITLDITVS